MSCLSLRGNDAQVGADDKGDVLGNRGASSIAERILSETKKEACNCKFDHPEGRG